MLQNGTYEIFEVGKSWDIIALPNNQILMVNFNDCLDIFNSENLELVMRINKINGRAFRALGIAIDLQDKKYFMTDLLSQRILVTDYEFNLVNFVGSEDLNTTKFDGPYDLCLTRKNIYICDQYKKNIHIYTKDLVFVKSLEVKCIPWKIKAINYMLFIHTYAGGIFIYDVSDLYKVKIKHYFPNHIECRISKINSNIYEFSHKTRKLICFDKKGNLKQETIFTSVHERFNDIWCGTFVNINPSCLIFTCHNGIVKISKTIQ